MKVFIDGKEGTTGLRIYERIRKNSALSLLTLSEEERKSVSARRDKINESDVTFLCLPDEAAKQAAGLVENKNTRIIDASTAHRTHSDWVYGLPELSTGQRERIKNATRVAVPGCHASGFIALVYPLLAAGALQRDALLSCFSLTGYSGGGKVMIAEYEAKAGEEGISCCRHYATAQAHKHLPEMQAVTGIAHPPVFNPVVGNYYAGMLVSVPLHTAMLRGIANLKDLQMLYERHYAGETLIGVLPYTQENRFIEANVFAGRDNMQLFFSGNEERITLYALYDNLGKGASGAALQCMNLLLDFEETEGLVL